MPRTAQLAEHPADDATHRRYKRMEAGQSLPGFELFDEAKTKLTHVRCPMNPEVQVSGFPSLRSINSFVQNNQDADVLICYVGTLQARRARTHSL